MVTRWHCITLSIGNVPVIAIRCNQDTEPLAKELALKLSRHEQRAQLLRRIVLKLAEDESRWPDEVKEIHDELKLTREESPCPPPQPENKSET